MSAIGTSLHQVEVRWLNVRLGAGIGLPAVEEGRQTVTLGGVELGRPEVAGQLVVHRMKAPIERPGRLAGSIRDDVMRRRIALIELTRLRGEEGPRGAGRFRP